MKLEQQDRNRINAAIADLIASVNTLTGVRVAPKPIKTRVVPMQTQKPQREEPVVVRRKRTQKTPEIEESTVATTAIPAAAPAAAIPVPEAAIADPVVAPPEPPIPAEAVAPEPVAKTEPEIQADLEVEPDEKPRRRKGKGKSKSKTKTLEADDVVIGRDDAEDEDDALAAMGLNDEVYDEDPE